MCDQTEISYSDGDIVWVKFHNLWWPGEVYGAKRLPPGLIESFRRLPVAVVKFFQENAYEYVKTINEIYRYNCSRKNEFIKKGMDIFRGKKRANMEKFPEDVGIAEKSTGGDPDIINRPEFQPEQKPDISKIFGDQTPKLKKGKGGRRKASPDEETPVSARTIKNTPKATPKSDYYLTPSRSSSAQNKTPQSSSTQGEADYKCQHCNFSTNRINMLLFHNKMHSSEKKPAPETKVVKPITPPPRKPAVKKTKMRSRAAYADIEDTDTDEEELENNRGIILNDASQSTSRSGRRSFVRVPPKKRQPRKATAVIPTQEIKTEKVEPVVVKPKDAAKQAQIKTSILADWGDDDDEDRVVDDEDDEGLESRPNESSEEPRELSQNTAQEKTDESPTKPIRNIPKKDRCRNLNTLDEFYKNQVPSSSTSNATDSAVIVLDSEDESDNDIRKLLEDQSDKEREESAHSSAHSSDDQVEEVIDEIDIDVKKSTDDEQEVQAVENEGDQENDMEIDTIQIEEKQIDDDQTQEANNETRQEENQDELSHQAQPEPKEDEKTNEANKENEIEIDSLLLKQGADLLEETSQLTVDIETVGVIEKKRRLQRKHKITESEDSTTPPNTVEEEQPATGKIFDEEESHEDSSKEEDIVENGENACEPEVEDVAAEEKIPEKEEINDDISEVVEEEKIETEENKEENTPENESAPTVEKDCIAEETEETPEAEESSAQESEDNENSHKIYGPEPMDVSENKENENQLAVESTETPLDTKELAEDIQKPEKQVTIEEPRPPSRHSLRKSKSESTESRKSSRSTRHKSKSQSIEKIKEVPAQKPIEEEKEGEEAPKEEVDSECCETKIDKKNIELKPETFEIPLEKEEIAEIAEMAKSSENHIKPDINISAAKIESVKTDVDCFDFKEEEDDIPKILSRPIRRPLEKRFLLDPIEDIRKSEEEELKILRTEQESKEKSIKIIIGKSPMKENDTNASDLAEAQTTPEKGLPIKERNKRIFKSRNRSMHSESDSFSNEEKTPTKQNAEPSKDSSVDKKQSSVSFELSVATSIESEIVDTLINNLPLSSPNSTSSSVTRDSPAPKDRIKAHKHALASQSSGDESPQPKKPIKMTFALSSGKNDKTTARIVKTDTDTEETKTSTEENEVAPPRNPRLTTKIAISKRKVIESSVEDIRLMPKRQKSSSDDDSKNSFEKANAIEANFSPNEMNEKIGASVETQSNAEIPGEISSPAGSTISSITLTLPTSTNVNASKSAQQMETLVAQYPEPKKKRKTNNSGKVEVVIGHDAAGNPITHYQKPRTGPVVHLPSHIRTPDMVAPPSSSPFSAKGGSQIVITSKGTLLTTNSTTDVVQSVSAVTQMSKSVRSSQQVNSPNKIQVHSQKIIASAQTIHHTPQHQIVEDLQKCGIIINEQVSAPQQKVKGRGKQQIISTTATNQIAAIETAQKLATNRTGLTKTGRMTKKQQLQLQQQELARRQAEAEKAAELSQNIQDNQLLAIPAENFDGPAGAFYLCTAENNTYFPIDRQPLYLDEKNQLVPMPGATGPMNVAAVQEDIIDDSAVHASNAAAAAAMEYATQAATSQITTNLSNLDESQNLTYLINTGDGQQILLDQQSMLQLTANGELPQFITTDGQQLILQGTPQDFLAALSNNQQDMNIVGGQQIIIPEDMTVIEEDGNNHDILAAALADTEVFQQDQYIGDVLQIQQGNGIETVEPNVLPFPINQATTSETNAILPPIMSTLEQPSKPIETAPSVDCSNLDESLAVIGVSAQQTNVPSSLELPITVTNPDIAPKTTNAMSGGIYPQVIGITRSTSQLSPSIPIVSEQDLTYELFDGQSTVTSVTEKNITTNIIINDASRIDNNSQDPASMDIDSNSEIIPNTPESVTNDDRSPELTGFTSDNSNNSCEIPLQSNLILRPPSTDGIGSHQQHIIGNRRNSDFLPNHYPVNHLNQHHQHSSLNSSPIRIDPLEPINQSSYEQQNHTASDSMLMGTSRHRTEVNGTNDPDRNQRNLFDMNRDNDDIDNHQFIVEEHLSNNHQFDNNDNDNDNDDDDVDDQYNR